MEPTAEQLQVIRYKGNGLVVQAFAGSGKTSTLVQYAKANPDLRMLYLAYNRAIRDEGVEKFPRNVDCKTSHQLAYAVYGQRFKHKLFPNIRMTDIAKAINTQNWEFIRDINSTLNNFMVSPDDRVKEYHFPKWDSKPGMTKKVVYQQGVIDAAQGLWARMISQEDNFPLVHDAYLKLYQLSKPDLSKKYQVILFDEAQDSNPVTADIVLRQQCRVLLVGDAHQQIYRWRGAENALDGKAMKNVDRLYLTHSFRFGQAVAAYANALLGLKGEAKKVTGQRQEGQVVLQLPDGLPHKTRLHRTVMGTLYSALGFAGAGKKIYWVGGIDGYNLQDIEDMYQFSKYRNDLVKNRRLIEGFYDYDQYRRVATETGDPEMLRTVKILEKYNDALPDMLKQLRMKTVASEFDADVTVSTAHRSKGLEWDYVELESDFNDIFDMGEDTKKRDDEINLLYVAATRAMKMLAVNDILDILARKFSLPLDRSIKTQTDKTMGGSLTCNT